MTRSVLEVLAFAGPLDAPRGVAGISQSGLHGSDGSRAYVSHGVHLRIV